MDALLVIFGVAEIFGSAYFRTQTGQEAVNGLKDTRTLTVNSQVFRGWNFAAFRLKEDKSMDQKSSFTLG
jgi:hypothetical protein